jgi:hypothetical protein
MLFAAESILSDAETIVSATMGMLLGTLTMLRGVLSIVSLAFFVVSGPFTVLLVIFLILFIAVPIGTPDATQLHSYDLQETKSLTIGEERKTKVLFAGSFESLAVTPLDRCRTVVLIKGNPGRLPIHFWCDRRVA